MTADEKKKKQPDVATNAGAAVGKYFADGAAQRADYAKRLAATPPRTFPSQPSPASRFIAGFQQAGAPPPGKPTTLTNSPSADPAKRGVYQVPAYAPPKGVAPSPTKAAGSVTTPPPQTVGGTLPALPAQPTPASQPNAIGTSPMNGGLGMRPIGVGADGVAKSLDANGNVVYTGTGAVTQTANDGPGAQRVSYIGPNAVAQGAGGVSRPTLAAVPTGIAMPQAATYTAPGRIRDQRATIGDGLPQDEIIRRMGHVAGDKMTATARRAMMGAYGDMLTGRNQMALQQQQGNIAGDLATQKGDIDGALGQQKTAGELLAEQIGQQGRERIAQIQRPDRSKLDIDAQGNLLTIEGGQASYVRGEDGNPVKRPAGGEGAITPALLLKSLSEQRASILSPDEAQAFDASPQGQLLQKLLSGGQNGAAVSQGKPPVPGAELAPDGNWYVKNADGSYNKVTP